MQQCESGHLKNVINLNETIQLARVAVNRAYIFSALSDKIKCIDVPDINLGLGCQFGLIHQNIWSEKQNEYKKYFTNWVACKCIEDVVESFESCIKALYNIIPIKQSAPSKYQKKNFINNQSLKQRLKTFQKIGIEVECKDSLESLSRVRTCLTHRQGIVDDKDLTESGGQFDIIWYRMASEAVGKKGGEDHCVQMDSPLDTWQFDKGSEITINAKIEKYKKTFPKYEPIVFTAKDIQDICLTMTIAIDSLYRNFVAKLKEWGFPVTTVNR